MVCEVGENLPVGGVGWPSTGERPPAAPTIPASESGYLSRNAQHLAAFFLLFGFTLLLCWPVTSGKVPVASDTLALWSPWSQLPHEPIANSAIADSALLYLSWNVFERNAIQDGEWPLWDPYTFSGTPFAANSQSQLYYPVTWLLWLLPLSAAIQYLTLFNVWFAGAGMYLLCRHFRLTLICSLVAAFGFAGSGMIQLALELPGVASPYGWLPWLLLAMDRALEARTAHWTALATLACGLQLVSGNLQWCIYSYFALACWVVWRTVGSFGSAGARKALGSLLPATIVMTGGVALAAVQLAPLLELTGLSTRGTTRISSHSGPLNSLLRVLMPQYFGTSVGDVGSPLVFNDLWYVGFGVLLLAILGLALPGRADRWLWAGVRAVRGAGHLRHWAFLVRSVAAGPQQSIAGAYRLSIHFFCLPPGCVWPGILASGVSI